MCSLYIYRYSLTITDRKFYRKVYIFFEDRPIIGKLACKRITFFGTHLTLIHSLTYSNCAVRVQVLCNAWLGNVR